MKKRLIGAIIILAVVIPIFLLGGVVWATGVGLACVLAYREFLNLGDFKKIPPVIKLFGLIGLLLVIYFNSLYDINFGISYGSLAFLGLFILLPTLYIKKYDTKEAFSIIGVIVFLGLIFNSFILLEMKNNLLLVYLLLISTMNDTFAYIIGCLIGKTKFSKISPNKTIEGSIGGLLCGSVIASGFYFTLISNENFIITVFITIILGIISQAGDLLFSKIKRENDIKDFSKLIPGHGGMLDRLDSFMIIVLAYMLILSL